ncbi:hypothetical protein FM104_02950 [Microbacterium esteraromaticum]|uniref:DUF6398 domain-containing protein n=1 Tax=Microbacterium esteraromaticum TaxID=57043 RepID=A0A1R4IN44_9MICO|nr:DUF6398 domain-containing protein [Microbacterium esteraromaticum]SJN21055.1 hypothetical protein FM104_02950 [Microbacterium esteraromaticum]
MSSPDSLINGLRESIRDPHPLALLDVASMLAASTEPDPMAELRAQIGGALDRPRLDRDQLVSAFLDVGERETDALLLVWARMLQDEVPAEQIVRDVRTRRHPLPRWLHNLDEVRPTRAIQASHVINDGDNLFIGVETPGRSFTIVLYIDHNMGTVPKDGYTVDRPIGDLISFSENQNVTDVTLTELLLEDARAQIEEVLQNESRLLHPFENDGWPSARPLLRWMLRLMPSGGTGYDRREWSDADLTELTRDFAASPHGTDADSDTLDRVETLLTFASSYGRADPLHWSNVVVEIMLVDLLPRKIMADQAYLRGMPDAMRRTVRFAHASREVPSEHTVSALAAVDHFEPEYLRLISEHGDESGELSLSVDEFFLRDAAARIGGFETLAALDDAPLPDEPLRLHDVPDAAREAASVVGEHLDRACTEFFKSVELRTAARRLLVQIAQVEPLTIVRGKPVNTALAICFIIGHANGLFSRSPAGLTIKSLSAYFAVKNPPNDRASALLSVLDINYYDWQDDGYPLGDAALLVSSVRTELIRVRDQLQESLADGV